MKNILFISLTVLVPFAGFAAGVATKPLKRILPIAEVVWHSGCEMPTQQVWHSDERGDALCLVADRLGEKLPRDFAQNLLNGIFSEDPKITHTVASQPVYANILFSSHLCKMYDRHIPIDWLRREKTSVDLALLLVIAKKGDMRLGCHLFSPNIARHRYLFDSPCRVEGEFDRDEFKFVDPVQCEHSIQMLYDRGEIKGVRKLVRRKLEKQHRDFALLVHPKGAWQRVDDGSSGKKRDRQEDTEDVMGYGLFFDGHGNSGWL